MERDNHAAGICPKPYLGMLEKATMNIEKANEEVRPFS